MFVRILFLVCLGLQLLYSSRLIKVFAAAELNDLSEASLASKEEVNAFQGPTRSFWIPKPHNNDGGPIENAEDYVEFPPNILNADRCDLNY
jgi:hypothetical protein